MTVELPPNPSFMPAQTWMRAFYDYTLAQTRISQANNPLPVLLAHVRANELDRAAQAGTMLFDAAVGQPVVANNAAWRLLMTARSATAAEILDLTSSVNVVYKEAGAIVYDSTNKTLAVANGPDAADTWSRLTISATVTPT